VVGIIVAVAVSSAEKTWKIVVGVLGGIITITLGVYILYICCKRQGLFEAR
jgi:hypothetical protein